MVKVTEFKVGMTRDERQVRRGEAADPGGGRRRRERDAGGAAQVVQGQRQERGAGCLNLMRLGPVLWRKDPHVDLGCRCSAGTASAMELPLRGWLQHRLRCRQHRRPARSQRSDAATSMAWATIGTASAARPAA
ncbi:hypothetical protein ON010_g17859 [Phytophthora cinnamomi]|nr:hypothetical protein ON010_g17859 [Phytophthora cinnamomi]